MSCCFIGQVMCCVTEDFEDRRKPDKRKLRRERRQAARETFLHEFQFFDLGKKAIRKMKAIEKSMLRKEEFDKLDRSLDAHFREQLKNGTNNVWIPRGEK
jgi:hypothetical protein